MRKFFRHNYIMLFVLLSLPFLVYNSNFRLIGSGDTQATGVLPLSLLQQGNLYVDQFASLYIGNIWNVPYFISFQKGHWLSAYPVVIPILVAPLYIPLAWFFNHYHISYDHLLALRLIEFMEKLSASFVASLSVIFLYLALCRLTSHSVAFGLALVYALASNTWVISSQALWQHGMAELLISLTLWLLLISDSSHRTLIGAGLASALVVANRPANLIVVAFLSLYVLHRFRSSSWRFFLLPPFVGTLFLSYNFFYFGTPTGVQGVHSGWSTPLLTGLAGLLVSPSRGLFIYTPWTLFSCWGMMQAWRSSYESPLFRYLSLGVIGEVLLYAKWGEWWGGTSFGPRFLTDILPLLIVLLLPVLQSIMRRRLVGAILAVTVFVAFSVQVLGAYFVFSGADHQSQRWSWRKSQLVGVLASLSPDQRVFADLIRYALGTLSSRSTAHENRAGTSPFPKNFSAMLLPSMIGRSIANPISAQGYVRRAENGQEGFLLYGPRLPLPPSRYKALFFLRAISTSHDEPIAILRVVMQEGTQHLAERVLVGSDFLDEPGFQAIILLFEVKPEAAREGIEYQVFSTGKTLIEVDRIEVWPDTAG
jgi:hypothetical protein